MNAAERREAALKRGVDELQNLLQYVKFAVKLYREIATARQ